jgi:hypothetical protein
MNNISKIQTNPTVKRWYNGRRMRLFWRVIFQKCSSNDSPQTKRASDNPSGQNVGDIEHNNISKKQPNLTVESQDMAAKVPGLLPSQNP